MGSISRIENLFECSMMICVPVSSQNCRDARSSVLREGEQSWGIIGGVDKQCLFAGNQEVTVIVRIRDGNVVKCQDISHGTQSSANTRIVGMFEV